MALPPTPRSPSPEDGRQNTEIYNDLYWSSESTDHDVYFGETNPPPLVAERIPSTYLYVTLNKGRTYYWQIIARNQEGETAGALWSFTTVAPQAPQKAAYPNPRNGETNVSIENNLYWASDSTDHDIYFGETNPPPLIASQVVATYLSINPEESKTYYWQVISRNETGETPSTIWSFTTAPPPPPFPETPSNLRAVVIKAEEVSLGWDANATISQYQVFRNGFFIGLAGSNSYIDHNLARLVSYTYEVKGINSSGVSNSSNQITVTTIDYSALSPGVQAKIKFHLQQANMAASESILTKEHNGGESFIIYEQVNRCNQALNNTAPNAAGNLVQIEQEVTDGNITVSTTYPTRWGNSTTTTTYGDRTVTTSRRPSYQQRLSSYYKEVEILADILGIELW